MNTPPAENFDPETGEVLDGPQLSVVDNQYTANPSAVDEFVEDSLPSLETVMKEHKEFERRYAG